MRKQIYEFRQTKKGSHSTVDALASWYCLPEKVSLKDDFDALYAEAQAATKADLALVLASFSIPLIGETASTKICSVVSSVSEISPETCKKAGLGEKATYNLCSWLAVTDLSQYPFDFKSKPNEITIGVSSKNINVCITGKLLDYKRREDAATYLKSLGFGITDSVTKSTNVLVDEEGKMSSKREKAVSYGITIITDLNDLLKENTND